jgi:hypothetical protein
MGTLRGLAAFPGRPRDTVVMGTLRRLAGQRREFMED